MIRNFTIVLALMCVAFWMGCSSNDSPTESFRSAADVNTYLWGLPSWQEAFPTPGFSDEATGPMETDLSVSGGTLYVCTSVPYSMTDTPGAVTTLSADTGVLSLGTLIQGNSYANGLGSLEELPIPQRAPLTVTTDLEFAANSATVTDPTSALVNQALEELIVAAGDAGFVAGSDVDYDQATCHSLDQGLLALNLSATFVDDGPRSQLEYEQNGNQTTVIAAFRQVMFTTSIVQPESPAGFFGDGFTEALLNEHLDEGRISSTNLPVYVADITWGRLLVMTVTSTYSDSEIRSAISASFTAILGGEVEAEYLELLTSPETSVGIATVGGETEQALAAVRTGSLGTYFASDAALTTAAPISYTLRSLADNSVASVGETVDYARTDCSADIVSYYDDFAQWGAAVLELPGGQITGHFTTAEGLVDAEELDTPPTDNLWITDILTFPGSATGLPFDFHLESLRGTFTFNDDELPDSYYPMLSVGDQGQMENDDFEIGITDV